MKKIVSFEIAKAIKDAGYDNNHMRGLYYNDKGESLIVTNITDLLEYDIPAPTYIDVWLWLWQNKGIYIDTKRVFTTEGIRVFCTVSYGVNLYYVQYRINPEEAIIAAIQYIVEHQILK